MNYSARLMLRVCRRDESGGARMGDQQKWFKLWTTAPADDGLLALPPEWRWAWCVLGCHTKAHGTDGRVVIQAGNPVLAAQMGIKPEVLKDVISVLPNVRVEEGNSRHGAFTVTWNHWRKYQEDSTSGERARRYRARAASRNKRRRDEKRKNPTAAAAPPAPLTPASLAAKYGPLAAYEGLDVEASAQRCLAWCLANRKGFTERRAVNWLNGDARGTAGATAAGRSLGATRQTAGNAAVLRRALDRDRGPAQR